MNFNVPQFEAGLTDEARLSLQAHRHLAKLAFGPRLEAPATYLATPQHEFMTELYGVMQDLYDDFDIDSDRGVYLPSVSGKDFHVRLNPFEISGYNRQPATWRMDLRGKWAYADDLILKNDKMPLLQRRMQPEKPHGRYKLPFVESTQATLGEVALLSDMIFDAKESLKIFGVKPQTSTAKPRIFDIL
jgi:hypothetical protein